MSNHKYWGWDVSNEDKRKYIIECGGYYNHFTDDNWVAVGIECINPDWAGISTDILYNALIVENEEIITIYK